MVGEGREIERREILVWFGWVWFEKKSTSNKTTRQEQDNETTRQQKEQDNKPTRHQDNKTTTRQQQDNNKTTTRQQDYKTTRQQNKKQRQKKKTHRINGPIKIVLNGNKGRDDAR